MSRYEERRLDGVIDRVNLEAINMRAYLTFNPRLPYVFPHLLEIGTNTDFSGRSHRNLDAIQKEPSKLQSVRLQFAISQ